MKKLIFILILILIISGCGKAPETKELDLDKLEPGEGRLIINAPPVPVPYKYEWTSVTEGKQYDSRIAITDLDITYAYCGDPNKLVSDHEFKMELFDNSGNKILFHNNYDRNSYFVDEWIFASFNKWTGDDCIARKDTLYFNVQEKEIKGDIIYQPWILPGMEANGLNIRIEAIHKPTGKVIDSHEMPIGATVKIGAGN